MTHPIPPGRSRPSVSRQHRRLAHELLRGRCEGGWCPPEAILPDTDAGAAKWVELNREYAGQWPNITRKKDAPADADDMKGVEGKLEKFFSPKPGGRD